MRKSQFRKRHPIRRFVLVVPFILMIAYTAQAEVTLCDCMNLPMDSDAKVATCTKIFESLDPETSQQERLACRDKPPPAGGPDICYCLKASYQDPDVIEKCEAMLEDKTEAQIMKHIRSCAGRAF